MVAQIHRRIDDAGQPVLAELKKTSLSLMKWDNEAGLAIRYEKHADELLKIYPVGPDFEIEAILLSKPRSNEFRFPVEKSANLAFHKQVGTGKPFHWLADTWTDTECFDKDCRRVAYRSPYVVDSLAVYSKQRNGKYSTGKFGHITRPLAVDANGRQTWCGLDYDGRAIVVTVPEKFLKEARYPVSIDPTVGRTSIGATAGGLSTGNIYTWGPYTPGANGTALAAYLYVIQQAGTEDVTLGVYDGTPTTLQGDSAGGVMLSGSGWRSQAISVSLTNGVAIRIAAAVSAHIDNPYDSIGDANILKFDGFTYVSGSLPASIAPGSNGDFAFSIYVDTVAAPTGTMVTWNLFEVDPADDAFSIVGVALQPAVVSGQPVGSMLVMFQ